MGSDGQLRKIPPSGIPVITKRLSAWWILAIGVGVTLIFIATDHMWRATGALSGTLALAALLRLALPTERAGGLVVRRMSIDVFLLLLLAIAVAAIGFNLDLRTLP